MEFVDDQIIELVNEYEAHPVLWNPAHSHYKLTSKKLEAWEEISEVMKVPVSGLKRKMGSLLASYRRERMKSLRMLAERGEPYACKWFAYDAFTFMNDVYHPQVVTAINDKTMTFSDIESFEDDEDNNEDGSKEAIRKMIETPKKEVEQPHAKRSEGSSSNNHSLRTVRSHQPARTNVREEPRSSQGFKLRKAQNFHPPKLVAERQYIRRDKFDIYGEYIAGEIRQLDAYSAAYAQKLIGEIIFDAKVGKYTREDLSTLQPQNE